MPTQSELLTESDRLVIFVFKYVMPAIGAALIFILGLIARWMRSVSTDLRAIRESLIRHDTIRDSHTKSIEKLEERCDINSQKLALLEIKVAQMQ